MGMQRPHLKCGYILLWHRGALLLLIYLGKDQGKGDLMLEQPLRTSKVNVLHGDAGIYEQQDIDQALPETVSPVSKPSPAWAGLGAVEPHGPQQIPLPMCRLHWKLFPCHPDWSTDRIHTGSHCLLEKPSGKIWRMEAKPHLLLSWNA